MKVNFLIKGFRDIQIDNRLIDLHNNFNFQRIDFEVATATLTLHWSKGVGEWIKPVELEKLIFVHQSVNYLKILNAMGTLYKGDEEVLTDLTFFQSTERDIDDRCLDQESPLEGDDIIYTFANGMIIRVGCTDVTLLI